MASVGTETARPKYNAFLNSFYPGVKRLIHRLEKIKDKIGRNEINQLKQKESCPPSEMKVMVLTTHIIYWRAGEWK